MLEDGVKTHEECDKDIETCLNDYSHFNGTVTFMPPSKHRATECTATCHTQHECGKLDYDVGLCVLSATVCQKVCLYPRTWYGLLMIFQICCNERNPGNCIISIFLNQDHHLNLYLLRQPNVMLGGAALKTILKE
jgi:hypothetical protein